MAERWKIRPERDRVELDEHGKGVAVFVVTNPRDERDEAIFDVLPADGADPAWFRVADAERLLLPGWSANYEVSVSVPRSALSGGAAGSLPGAYALRGRVSSTSTRDAESSVVSSPVRLGHGGSSGAGAESPAQQGESGPRARLRGLPRWKWMVPLGLVVLLVLGIGGWLIFRKTAVDVPSEAGRTLASARKDLVSRELAVGSVRRRHDLQATAGTVLSQSPRAGTPLDPGRKVDLVLAIHLDGPTLVSPADGARVAGRTFPHLEWQPVPDATGYQVVVEREWCLKLPVGKPSCRWITDRVRITGTTSARPILSRQPSENLFDGKVRWQISALDDFGRPGSPSQRYTFQLHR